MPSAKSTYAVADDVFRAVYDAPSALPGRHRWVTPDADVRKLEEILEIPERSIGAPLWVSGDEDACPKCGRRMSWLDIVSSALAATHGRAMIARVIMGGQKFVNTEAPRAIAGVHCSDCGTAIRGLRSFKCHNWAYAMPAIERLLVERSAGRRS